MLPSSNVIERYLNLMWPVASMILSISISTALLLWGINLCVRATLDPHAIEDRWVYLGVAFLLVFLSLTLTGYAR